MNEFDDTLLAAYMDAELDAASTREIESALAVDPRLRLRLERMRVAEHTVRAAFDEVARLPLPPLRVPTGSFAAMVARRQRRLLPWAAAASLAALVATGAVSYRLGQIEQASVTASLEAETASMHKTFQKVIDTELSGTTVEWRSPRGTARAEFTPVRTWKTETGRYCREFTELVVREGVQHLEGGVACRRDDGSWRVRVRYFPD